MDRNKRNWNHRKIYRHQKDTTGKLIKAGGELHNVLFPSNVPPKYFVDMVNNYDAIGIKVYNKETYMDGTRYSIKYDGELK